MATAIDKITFVELPRREGRKVLKGLSAARKRQGLSQAELSECSGFTQSYISQLEAGKKSGGEMKTPYKTIVLLSKILKTTPEFLQEGEEDGNEGARG